MSDEDAHIVDPDVDPVAPELRRVPWTTLGAISVGGVLGSLARYQMTVAFPHRPDAFGWATWSINVSGCLLIGVLMVALTEVWRAHRLVRPFLGVGVLGGFTTFSTHIIEAQRALEAGAPGTGLLYLAVTLAGALVAVYAGAKLTRLAVRRGGGRS
ncbi:fluoride efflux transporter FluC [Actinomadura welshii]